MTQTYPLKCRIRAAGGTTRVDVYDDIGEDWLGGGLTAKGFSAQLAGVKGALDVHINSCGGDVFDGVAIGNALRAHKGPVTTVVDGLAASIASVIMQAGAERVVQPGSMVMIHDAHGVAVGNAAECAKFADTLSQVSDNIADLYASRSGHPAAHWREQMQAETWYTAEEAVAAGLADRVGEGAAALPPGLDVAAYTQVPGRIAAALRSLPKATAGEPAGPLTVEAIRAVIRAELAACGLRNDSTQHQPMTGSHAHPHENYGDDLAHEHTHDGDADHGTQDPDGDGDDDSTAAGDTDHDYVAPDGSPGPKAALSHTDVLAMFAGEISQLSAGRKE